jgi:hypothetical protein
MNLNIQTLLLNFRFLFHFICLSLTALKKGHRNDRHS